MPQARPSKPFLQEPLGSFDAHVDISPVMVWIAALALFALAALGAYKGAIAAHPGPGSGLLSPQALTAGKPVDAATAVPLARDANWSTLNGPQILTPPSAKPAAAAAAEDAADSSDGADDNTADNTDNTDNTDDAADTGPPTQPHPPIGPAQDRPLAAGSPDAPHTPATP
jgi:hypothetical protein